MSDLAEAMERHGRSWIVGDPYSEKRALDCDKAADKITEQAAVIDRLTKALAVVLFEYDDVDIAEGEPPTMTDAINCARAALGESK